MAVEFNITSYQLMRTMGPEFKSSQALSVTCFMHRIAHQVSDTSRNQKQWTDSHRLWWCLTDCTQLTQGHVTFY